MPVFVKGYARKGKRVAGYTRNSILKAIKSVRSSKSPAKIHRLVELESQALKKVKNTHNFIKKNFPDRANKRLRYGLRVN